MRNNLWQRVAIAALAILMAGPLWAARESNIRATKHNFSSAADASAVPGRPGSVVPTRTVKATSETQVCVFCHTPHAATSGATPLWNRKLSTASYSLYTSNSLDAKAIQTALDQPGGSSKLCLSCHDGTLAIGNVNVLNGAGSATTPGTVSIGMTGTGTGGVMPDSAKTTGFTRFLDADFSNDHPISVTYNKTLADRDGELRAVAATTQKDTGTTGALIGVRSSGYKPKMPLEPTGSGTEKGQIQCATCHDPHIRETDSNLGNQKFLRLNRFQAAQPGGGAFSETNDIICLACHDKGGTSWAFSAHANSLVANETYLATPAGTREFPANLPVWKAACLNCHDTHTVPGARRLLREGTNNTSTPKQGGSSAIEETCYQCHTSVASSILSTTAPSPVPDIKTDFTTLTYKMPITGTEVHDIGGNFSEPYVNCSGADAANPKCGADFIEQRTLLGVTALGNRHAECTDCHNPHRVIKSKDGLPGVLTQSNTNGGSGTHNHRDTTSHTNIISGVLRGAWGVQPTYTSASFHAQASGYDVKRGNPGAALSSTSVPGDAYVTREYQICMKCHSDYGYSDNNTYPAGNRPALGSYTGGTPTTTSNGLTIYTNQAKEFQAPTGHKGEGINMGNDAGSADSTSGTGRFNVRNHRSWHPVMESTGRDASARNVSASSAWRQPWSNALGTQTMYCTDCHGSTSASGDVRPTGNGTDSAPTEDGKPWGPHGSENPFILKGAWHDAKADTTNLLCLKCHNPFSSSGFAGGGKSNLHQHHQDKLGALRCTWCHVAVPHGWKNRSLLVNLNDVGQEAGQGAGSSKEVAISNSSSSYYSQEPYYYKAKLKILSFAAAGSWADTSCGSAGKSGTGLTTGIINGSAGSSNGGGSGKDWMITNACNSGP